MPAAPGFDLAEAHRFFAADCFNRAWDLIEKPDRTPEDDRTMAALSRASIYHWSQRPDCTDRNRSVGYWQASRIQSLIGNGREALRLSEICLSYSADLPPFFIAYAHEALARALVQLDRRDDAGRHLAATREQLPLVKTQEDRDRLNADLGELD
jgi:hypothetical protein